MHKIQNKKCKQSHCALPKNCRCEHFSIHSLCTWVYKFKIIKCFYQVLIFIVTEEFSKKVDRNRHSWSRSLHMKYGTGSQHRQVYPTHGQSSYQQRVSKVRRVPHSVQFHWSQMCCLQAEIDNVYNVSRD